MNQTYSVVPVASEVHEDKYIGYATREDAISHCCSMSLYVPATLGLISFFPGIGCCTMCSLVCFFSTCSNVTGKECAKCYIKYNE